MHPVNLPPGKSMLNRYLVLSALSNTETFYLPDEEDLPNDVRILNRLLFQNDTKEYNVEDAGTAYRFLVAYLALKTGRHKVYGTERLNQRPIMPLIEALKDLGATIRLTSGGAPLYIEGSNLGGGTVLLDATLSSQFVSALMLIGPRLAKGIKIRLKGLSSAPYIRITEKCLKDFGVPVRINGNSIEISHANVFKPNRNSLSNIESDWSSAAFWYSLCALTQRSFRLRGLSFDSVQGDKTCAVFYRKLGVESQPTIDGVDILFHGNIEQHLEFNLIDTPDLAPPIIVACSLLRVKAKFFGLTTLVSKESNRLKALQTELAKLKTALVAVADHYELKGDFISQEEFMNIEATLSGFNDHRLVMAFAAASVLNPKIKIADAQSVSKSYPGFWKEINAAFIDSGVDFPVQKS
jgi:3-phosphoshikimate 1-carboxyvinyltransferase